MQHKSSRAFCWLRCLLTYSKKYFMTSLGKGLLPTCLILKQNAAVTNGNFNMMARLRTRLVTQWSTWRKRRSISSILTYCPQTDLNPVDYAVWGALQQRVYHGRKFKTVEELKQTFVTEWKNLSQRFIDSCINE